jgi:uroporphyrinogen-III synthase
MIGVLNTRPKSAEHHGADGESSALSRALKAAGFDTVEVPLVELILLTDVLNLMEKLSGDHFDGILLSSPNLLPLMKAAARDVPATWKTKPWYLIGPRSRADVEALGVSIAFVPQQPSLEDFLQEIPLQQNLRLIHPCSTKTRLEPALFKAKGLDVHNMAVYEPRCPAGAAAALEAAWPRILPTGAVLFASGSAVHHFFAAAPRLARTLSDTGGPMPVSIGASTTRALRMYGITRAQEAPTADTAGFLAALKSIYPDIDPESGSKA